MAYLENEGLEITFRMESDYFDDKILETIESFGCTYVINSWPGRSSEWQGVWC